MERDEQGRLKKGHGGLKPVGAKSSDIFDLTIGLNPLTNSAAYSFGFITYHLLLFVLAHQRHPQSYCVPALV